METRSQRYAQAAFPAVKHHFPEPSKNLSQKQKQYRTIAKKFPSLIHTCGLAQAIAFAQAKKEDEYLDDLASVLTEVNLAQKITAQDLVQKSRQEKLSGYLRLSRNALLAAGWLKRYVETLNEKEDNEQ